VEDLMDWHANAPLAGKRVLVTGGTGSLGKLLVKRLLTGELGLPEKVIVYSRDEAKQHFMRVESQRRVHTPVTDEVIYQDHANTLEFRIGDVRDYAATARVLRDVDLVVNAAAMKQVPACEYAPWEAVRTNVEGAENIVRAIAEHRLPIDTVVGVSTDKACKPVNVMGMTKALQERVFIQANMVAPSTRFLCVRYGNVLASRGSVIPLFHDQIRHGGPVTITTTDMTRFLLSLNDAVDTIFAALTTGGAGETYVPRAPSALITHVAAALIGDRGIPTVVTGLRPGEKVHEIMISDEEAQRAVQRGNWYAILPMLPELSPTTGVTQCMTGEYSSGSEVMTLDETSALLRRQRLMVDDVELDQMELLR
jgi:FlaA1/EpsC-like NDP-sugar epimerase